MSDPGLKSDLIWGESTSMALSSRPKDEGGDPEIAGSLYK